MRDSFSVPLLLKGEIKMNYLIKKIALSAISAGIFLTAVTGCGSKSSSSSVSERKIKKEISAAESAASTTSKAFGATLIDLEELGCDVSFTGWIELDGSWGNEHKEPELNGEKLTAENAHELLNYGISTYFVDITEVKDGAVYIQYGDCLGVCCTTDGKYWGTYPGGLVTEEDYKNDSAISKEECKSRVSETLGINE